ncbi:MAG TPA: ABC transporter ATP-binding protein [Ramlibacter sp.]|nr:ABC transporter ATP-binding protein [Ramlibacter sp.]
MSAVPSQLPARRPSRLALSGLRKAFAGTTALHQIDLETREGEFISLLGPSGCGKTTTLRCIAGFEAPDAGRVLLDGRDITGQPPERRDIGMVFQNYALFPHLTVARNLAFGLEMRGLTRSEIARRVGGVLEMVQLTTMAERYPRQLSGGQQQRVALARALVIEPRLLLLDEPLANLDAVLREDMRVFIRDLQQRVGITALYVTHDQSEAMVMSDRVAVMLGGRLQQFDTPENIYLRPRSADVARFIGRANLVAGTVQARRAVQGEYARFQVRTAGGVVEAEFDGHLPEGQPVQVAVRPEALRLAADGALRGMVQATYFLGSAVEHSVQCAGDIVLRAQTAPGGRLSPGSSTGIAFDPAQAWIIPEAP